MKKIISLNKAIQISKELKDKNKKIIVAGGCFDIIHLGHTRFINNSKNYGDVLFILLENDNNVKKLKGKNRPINSQKDRAEILSAFENIDYVVMLPVLNSNNDYDNLIKRINPDIITVTKNDPQIIHNKRQAKMINAQIKIVINRIKDKSSSRLAEIISKYF